MTKYRIEVEPQETSNIWPSMWESDARWIWRVFDDSAEHPWHSKGSGVAWFKALGVMKARLSRMKLEVADRHMRRSKRRVAKFATRLAKISGETQ